VSQRLVLDLRPPESRHYGSWAERLTQVARYSRPDELHALCEKAWAVGARSMMAVVNDPIREALIAFQRWREAPLWAVVPNMTAFIRDLTDLGMVGAARARFMRLRPRDMARIGFGAVGSLGGIRRRDFATGTMLVADMELAGLRGLHVRRLFLHPQVTEIALAGGVRELFTAIATRAERLGIEAGLVTNNPVRAAAVIGKDLARFAVVVSPANPKGYKMFPDRQSVEALFRSDPTRFIGSEIDAGGSVAPATALAYVRELGLAGAVLDPRLVERLFAGTTSVSGPRSPAAA
jgi:hypothetical protein